jgi:hypothetical protein
VDPTLGNLSTISPPIQFRYKIHHAAERKETKKNHTHTHTHTHTQSLVTTVTVILASSTDSPPQQATTTLDCYNDYDSSSIHRNSPGPTDRHELPVTKEERKRGKKIKSIRKGRTSLHGCRKGGIPKSINSREPQASFLAAGATRPPTSPPSQGHQPNTSRNRSRGGGGGGGGGASTGPLPLRSSPSPRLLARSK